MYRRFILKHRDDPAALLFIESRTGEICGVKVKNKRFLPYLGNAKADDIRKWWKMRGIPKSRHELKELLKKEGCATSELFLMKNLGLSLTDSYWICPAEVPELSWEQVNLFDLDDEKVEFKAEVIKGKAGMAFTRNPAASLTASSDAYWAKTDGEWWLYKKDATHDGQQSANETFASWLHDAQGRSEYTEYFRFRCGDGRKTGSRCKAFTSKNLELVPAYEVVCSEKKRNDVSAYEHYISVCVKLGLSESYIRNFLDYQTLSDFLLTNTDRHYNNFGILRDAKKLEIVSAAPLYDTGNSMFWNDLYTGTRADLLATKVTSIARTEEKMLRYVKDPLALDLSLTPNIREVERFYILHGIEEPKAKIIAKNYGTKRELLYELQQGRKLSVYMERQSEKQRK